MKFVSIDQYFRKRSGASSLFLHIPLVNYFAFIFQIRGAYIAVKNYCYLNKELASAGKVFSISIKYSIFGAMASILLYSFLLFLFDMNYHGEMAAYYLSAMGNFIAPLFDIDTAGLIFGEVPHQLSKGVVSNYMYLLNIGIILGTYVIFGFVGSFWALLNIKSDLKRSIINKPLFEADAQPQIIY